MHEWEEQRKGESQADSVLSTEPNVRLDPMSLRSRPEPKPRIDCSTDRATSVPHYY